MAPKLAEEIAKLRKEVEQVGEIWDLINRIVKKLFNWDWVKLTINWGIWK